MSIPFHAMGIGLALLALPTEAVVAQTSHPNAPPVVRERPASAGIHTGPSAAVIYDVATHIITKVSIQADDTTLKNSGILPMNGVQIDIPQHPAKRQFARVEFNDGATYCSASYLGGRYFLTAGHCVFDGGSFRISANVFPGYENGLAPIGAFSAHRMITFNGWSDSQDYSHDLGIIEVDKDLPGGIPTVEIRSLRPSCDDSMNIAFERYFYQGIVKDQLMNQGNHIGCEGNQIWFFIPTNPGSSGSTSNLLGTNQAYAVRSNFSGPKGFDTWITSAKACFIRGNLIGKSC